MQRIVAFWNRGWIGKAAISLAVLVVACCVIGIFAPRTPRPASTSAPTSAAVQPAAAAQTEAPTAAPAPTEAPKPTNTPAPTETPAPTATPTEIPTPTPLPEPITLKGHGKIVTDKFTPPYSINRVTFEHNGERNFIVKSYAKDGKEDYLVNAIGPYHGMRPLLGDQELYFEIDADGDWTAVIEPLGQNDLYAGGADGSGDFVSDLFMPAKEGAVPYTFSHDGERNFIVQLHCAGGEDFVANEIGTTQGQVVVKMRKGPCLWEVQADGKWTIHPK
jgi:hypothetical protein